MGNGERRPPSGGIGGVDEEKFTKIIKTTPDDDLKDLVWADGDRYTYTKRPKPVAPDSGQPSDMVGVEWGEEREREINRGASREKYSVGLFIPFAHSSLYGSLATEADRKDNSLFQDHLKMGWLEVREDGVVLKEGATKYFNDIFTRRLQMTKSKGKIKKGEVTRPVRAEPTRDASLVTEERKKYQPGQELSLKSTPLGDLTRFERIENELRKLEKRGLVRIVDSKVFLTSKGADHFNEADELAKANRAARKKVRFPSSHRKSTFSSPVENIPDFDRESQWTVPFKQMIEEEIEDQFSLLSTEYESLLTALYERGYVLDMYEVQAKKGAHVEGYRVDILKGGAKKKFRAAIILERKRLKRDVEEKLIPVLIQLAGIEL
ncbi:MAG TPA: hypothetical protein VJH75_00100 [Patescibacteria group bacterium]|nr:hypothetical protein [Patescibacteria group bacterium]